jgi:hypothetical protein
MTFMTPPPLTPSPKREGEKDNLRFKILDYDYSSKNNLYIRRFSQKKNRIQVFFSIFVKKNKNDFR